MADPPVESCSRSIPSRIPLRPESTKHLSAPLVFDIRHPFPRVGHPGQDKEEIGQTVEIAAHGFVGLLLATQGDDPPLRPARQHAGDVKEAATALPPGSTK